nr:putative ribonuclease H-like domain-containing protein [Tanacetum cinerariifolium]
GNSQQNLKDKGVIDSGCSRNMIVNKSYLIDYEEINGGFVSFRGNSKGEKITRKGKIRSGKLDFEDVYFVKKLMFNLFSVSEMCDKKNGVLFTDTACVILSPDFKLTDESHVLLKVSRKDNMYSVDLKNVVPQGGLTCLFEKSTSEESNLWHRRLGHVNFKTINKLVKRNLVRGRKPALSFIRLFRCPVTILNTIDHLGKFDGKADEGFFVGYSTNSKTFRVFNSRTRIVEENLHVKFSENTPNIVGNTPKWLFDIDALTKSMNYKPVVARNQSNGSTGNEDSKIPSTEDPRVDQEEKDSVNSTNKVNVGHTQKEGINYDEVFAPVAKIKAIRLFLTYASFKDLVVYQMDVKSAFIYGKIKEETASTPMETYKILLKDEEGKDVNEHLYRSMIGSLMYLTSLRPDIMFADLPFDLVAYTDSDYAGASLDRKSITGGYQFRGCRLISWQCKKQTVFANSTTEIKIYIDNESTICIVKNPIFYSKKKHIEIRHHFIRDSNEKKLIQMIKIHTDNNVADLLTKTFDPTESKGFEQIIDFLNAHPIKYALTVNLTIYTSFVEQLWTTAKAKNINEEAQIHAKMHDSLEMYDSLERATTTATGLDAEKDKGNITKTQSKKILNEPSSIGTSSGSGPKHQDTIEDAATQTRVLNLETTKTAQLKEIANLKKRVNMLERKRKSRLHGLKRLYKVELRERVESPADEESLDEENSSKRGRIYDIDANQDIYLVNVYRDEDIFGVNDQDDTSMFDADKDLQGEEVVVEEVNVAATTLTISMDEITLAKALIDIKTSRPKERELLSDYEMKQRLQAEEQEQLTDSEKVKFFMEFLEKRRKFFAAKRAEEKRNKPPTKAQQRSLMSTYLKNMDGWKPRALKNKSFAEIKELFDEAMARINNFVDFRTELVEENTKKAQAKIAQESSLKLQLLITRSTKKGRKAFSKSSEQMGYALESVARILIRVPTKKVEMTPYEIWHEKAPKIPKGNDGLLLLLSTQEQDFVARNAEFFENSLMKSAKKSTTAMSSTEAKYIVAVEASMEAFWMRKFIDGHGNVMPSNKRPTKMLCDNEPAIKIANDLEILKRARHF